MTQPLIRMTFPFNQADRRHLDQIEREDSAIVSTRIGPEGERQVCTLNGEIFNLNTPRIQAKRLARFGGGNHNPTPPAPAAAIRAAA